MEDSQDSRTYSREFMIEFIDLNQTLPAVWKVKSKSYSDRNLKNAAYEKLISKLREVEPNADRETAVKKINNIRSSYRREFLKKLNSRCTQELEVMMCTLQHCGTSLCYRFYLIKKHQGLLHLTWTNQQIRYVKQLQ
jgi:hypothetical protein